MGNDDKTARRDAHLCAWMNNNVHISSSGPEQHVDGVAHTLGYTPL